MDEVFILAAASEPSLSFLEALAGDIDRIPQLFVVSIAALVDHPLYDFIAEGKKTGLLDGGLGFLTVEENLVGGSDGIDEDDLAWPEGIILAFREDDVAHLVLHHIITGETINNT